MFSRFVAAATFFVIVFVIVGAVCALPTMWLWNWLTPVMFPEAHIGKLTFFQAFGLNMLCSFLFKSSHSSASKQE